MVVWCGWFYSKVYIFMMWFLVYDNKIYYWKRKMVIIGLYIIYKLLLFCVVVWLNVDLEKIFGKCLGKVMFFFDGVDKLLIWLNFKCLMSVINVVC